MRWVAEWCVINVLADVVLVEAHRTVWRQSQILRVRHVHMLRNGIRVLETHVPEPGGRAPGEHQGYRVVDTEPRADPHGHTAGGVSMKPSRTEWPQKRRP